MTNECSKAVVRRMNDPSFMRSYFVGEGIDIGAGRDSLAQYGEFFPLMTNCKSWDVGDGDAQEMVGLSSQSLDFVHSSHCLEHLVDPYRALGRWLELLRSGGHLVCIVPDEDLYEQGVWPSTFNGDHKHTFTIHKAKSWSPASINLFDLLRLEGTSVQQIKLLNATTRASMRRVDQTLTPIGESAIEFVVRKDCHV